VTVCPPLVEYILMAPMVHKVVSVVVMKLSPDC
jgi:hypothetical protein